MSTQTHIAYHMEVLRKAQVIRRKNEALQRMQKAREKEEAEKAMEEKALCEREGKAARSAEDKREERRGVKRVISNTSSDLSWVSDRSIYTSLNKFAEKVREAKTEPPRPMYSENGLKRYISLQGLRNKSTKRPLENTVFSRHLLRQRDLKIHPANHYTELYAGQIYPSKHTCFQCWRGIEDNPVYYGQHNPRLHKLGV